MIDENHEPVDKKASENTHKQEMGMYRGHSDHAELYKHAAEATGMSSMDHVNIHGPMQTKGDMDATGHEGHSTHQEGTSHSEHQGHAAHVDHTGHEQMFRKRFWICLVLTIPVLLYSPMIQQWLGFNMPTFSGSQWITPAFSVGIFLYGGLPFLRMARPEIQNHHPGMMTLISLAIIVAFVYSVFALFLPTGSSFFWELVTLIDIMLLGHWLEMRSIRQASGALNELAKLMPDTAERLQGDGSIEEIPASQLQNGDLVLVRPGASIPADGQVEEGESDLDEALITGESLPDKKGPGDQVIAGTINGDGSLRVKVTATGDQTALAGIMRLVEQAQQSKSNTQILADRAAGWLFYIALGTAAITAIAWIIAVGVNVEVLARVATVLVIACPHALGLAVPLVVAITTAKGAQNGILVRDRLALEQAREVNTVIFDKTGTLTRGEFGVVGIITSNGWNEDQTLALAAAIEGDSEHTIARGIRNSAQERQLAIPEVTEFEALKGRGVRAERDGQLIYVGGPRLLEMLELDPPEEITAFGHEASLKGQSVVYLVQGKSKHPQVVAALAMADVIRPESRQAIDKMHDLGIEIAMLTGDSQPVAKAVAEELHIDTYFAEVLPEFKDQKVADLQKQGKKVAMVGDGVNDAPALSRADVGIAIGGGTDVAIESAGIILVRSNPLDVVKIFDLSQASYRKMVENLVWATAYNVVALPLAAGILAPIGILLSPAVGALFMSLSTVIVAINAQTLRRMKFST
jgi:Cu2+-exporting ATPase